jgi:probable rRNA maturation factor
MMINIFIDDQYQDQIDPSLIDKSVLATLKHQDASLLTSELSVSIQGDDEIHELNRTYRGIDRPTDVLSFPSDEKDPESGLTYIGDIMISFLRVLSQAAERNLSPEFELQLLIVHGVLHLLGHDHGEIEEKNTMWKAQEEILLSLGYDLEQIRLI